MTRIPARARLTGATAVLLLLALSGCKKTVEPETVEALTVVSGDLQARQAGRQLRAPIVFRAIGGDGTGVANAVITLVVAQGGGAVDSASVHTDANGEARVKWTLGPDAAQVLSASVPGREAVRVTATGIQPRDIIVAQGNNQSARVSVALANNVVVRVLGGDNVPMDSINVTFTIAGGGGGHLAAEHPHQHLGRGHREMDDGPCGRRQQRAGARRDHRPRHAQRHRHALSAGPAAGVR